MRIKNQELLSILILLFLSLLFFYGLGKGSLFSFDEAWHAEVARNIIKRKNIFLLWFNGAPFLDQPPVSFWLTALSYKLLGINEFAARFSSAVLGFGSILILYLIGSKLYNKTVGFLSSLMLSSSVWFILRARSGNLDAVLTFFILFSLYLATKIKKDSLYLYLLSISMALLLLVKFFIGLGIAPIILYFLYKNRNKFRPEQYFLALILFLIIFLPYYIINFVQFGQEFQDHIWATASRGRSQIFQIHYQLPLFYLHMGVREWYYPAIVAFFGNLLFLKMTSVRLIYLYLLAYLLPFLTSSKTEIWHLIPLYPAIGLMIFSFVDNCYKFFFELFKKKKIFKKYKKLAIRIIIVGGFLFGLKQINEFKQEVFLKNSIPSNEARLSAKAVNYKESLYIADYYLPEAVFYSGKQVNLVGFENQGSSTQRLFQSEDSFLLLTTKNDLQNNKIYKDKYIIIAQEGDKILVKKK